MLSLKWWRSTNLPIYFWDWEKHKRMINIKHNWRGIKAWTHSIRVTKSRVNFFPIKRDLLDGIKIWSLCLEKYLWDFNFISNLNQVFPGDRTRDMLVFFRHVHAVTEYLIATDIPNIARYSHLTRAIPVPKVIHGCYFWFSSGLKSFCPTGYSNFSEECQICREKWTGPSQD